MAGRVLLSFLVMSDLFGSSSSDEEEAPDRSGIQYVQPPPPVWYLEPRNRFFPCTVVLAHGVKSVRIQQVYADTQEPVAQPDFTIRGAPGRIYYSLDAWESEEVADRILRLEIKYNQLTSKHQHRPFALRIQAQQGAHPPVVVGSTRVKTRKSRPRLPQADAPVVAKVCTGEELADARQRMAEERGEVCDLTGEEPPAKQAKH